MIIMKKISYILLSVVFVLVIAGCSNNQKNANIKTEKQTESQKQTEAEKESVTNAVKEAATEATSEAVTEASTEVTNPKEDSDSEHAVEKKSDNAQKAETNENLPKEKEAAKQSDKNAEKDLNDKYITVKCDINPHEAHEIIKEMDKCIDKLDDVFARISKNLSSIFGW